MAPPPPPPVKNTPTHAKPVRERQNSLVPFLASIKLEKYVSNLAKNDVDLETLPAISDEELLKMGLTVGAVRKIKIKLAQDAGGEKGKTLNMV